MPLQIAVRTRPGRSGVPLRASEECPGAREGVAGGSSAEGEAWAAWGGEDEPTVGTVRGA
ncbi:MAG: hypothetical protein M1823_009101, partial [Watsoniomyces obsoletus]